MAIKNIRRAKYYKKMYLKKLIFQRKNVGK